jgi:pilus assembly protein CpaB
MTSFWQRVLLALGVAGIVAGMALGVAWMRAPKAMAAETDRRQEANVLVAVRAIAPGTLLRESDLGWRPLTGARPAGAFTQASTSKVAVVGSAARRGFAAGEILVSDALVRPDQRDFLAATLAPGQRAVTIPVDAPQSASGLLLPGDRIDVILVQEVGEGDRRLAAETVLHNSRVLAVGANLNPNKGLPLLDAPVLAPKTITLEASPRDAERLFLAAKLGDLQLAVRGVGDVAAPADAAPVWAGEVSEAARWRRPAPAAGLAAQKAASSGAATPRPGAPQVLVLRGTLPGTAL